LCRCVIIQMMSASRDRNRSGGSSRAKWLVPAIIAAAAAIAAAFISRSGGTPQPLQTAPLQTAALEVIELAPVNAPPHLVQSAGSVQASYDARTTAGVVITLRNPGTAISVINRARVSVLRYAAFSEEGCIPGAGPIPISTHYDAGLPVGTEQSVDIALSQQVPANSADRLAIGFRPSAGYVDSGGTGASRLYALDIKLYHDNVSTPLAAGKVVLAVPFPEVPFLARFKPHVSGALSSACVPHNTAVLQTMLGLPYAHSNALAEFASNPCEGDQQLAAEWECPPS
jgi:hypothetical protein